MSVFDYMRSQEEVAIALWLDECFEAGLIDTWEYEPVKIKISGRETSNLYKPMKRGPRRYKEVERAIIHAESYTPDFVVSGFDTDFNYFAGMHSTAYDKDVYVMMDVKGIAGRSSIGWGHKQKLLYYYAMVFVNKVIPEKLFKKTFVPFKKCLYTHTEKKGLLQKRFHGCRIGVASWVDDVWKGRHGGK